MIVFTLIGVWELCKFSDFTKLSQGLQIAIVDRFSTPDINREFYITNEFLSTKSTKKYYIENPPATVIADKDDILMTRTGNTGKVVTNTKGAFHNNFFKIAYNKKKTSKLFLYFLLTSPPIQKEILIRAGTSTIPDLNHNDFYKIIVKIPSEKEQQKIGNLLKKIDDIITLHQRKLEQLKELKKAYLQLMFPKKDEIVPRMRFVDFEGEWELCKLGDVANRYDNLRVPITASKRISGNTPYYGANGIQDFVEGYTHDGEFILVAEDGANDLKDYPVQYVNGKVWVNNHAHVLQAKQSIANNKFLMNAIKNINIELFLVGGSRAKLNADIMMKLEINMPVKNEQIRVSEFCTQLDNIITIYQNKLNQLKSLKKSYLQNMFI
ncbi:restriction endonuclease subunit S [Enterococcus faecalis]|uniref:restriction endonuclease subunit S n=1 Tax=Enterococcus faecalis TaxID=1351 RepID=UPI001CF29311|nr:restriction endonuclease subunit S [Enterococcus faecalis]MCA6711928.1 restriction endonuclease subunit S [Enterococcus faecalis]MCA6730911.1 restriction endonuclease subunit S [Enterococcus faecalis]